MRILTVALAAAAQLAGCGGGSGDRTAAAATCLRNALANQALGGNNCGDSTAASIASKVETINVSCTHKDANEYICDVTGSSSLPTPVQLVQTGFYTVTYDGKSIVYQQTQ